MASINTVYSVTAEGSDPSALIVSANITDYRGETYDCEYCTRPVAETDPMSMNALFQQWLSDHSGDYTVLPFTPPTAEDARATMQPLTARQLRLGLVTNGISPTQVQATLEAMPAGVDRDKALIEWEYATTFNRMHPLISTVGSSLGLTEEQIDEMWTAALSF